MMKKVKNYLLLSTYVISMIPTYFFGTKERMWLSVFHGRENTTRLDFVALYYTISINFLIMAYSLHYNKGISKDVTRFILIVCGLDLLHLFLYGKQGFGFSKVIVALLLFLIPKIKKYILSLKGEFKYE